LFAFNIFRAKDKKKIYKFSSSRGILHISAKLYGGICKTSCWLTEEFDGGDKLINVVQFQGGNWNFVNFRGVIDETYNFRRVIAYLLHNWREVVSYYVFGLAATRIDFDRIEFEKIDSGKSEFDVNWFLFENTHLKVILMSCCCLGTLNQNWF